MTSGSRKEYRRGTHRLRPSVETVQHVWRLAGALGITRVANITGLDVIGIPVVMVCRPNSRSLSVSQGKGVTIDDARASGLMESVELYHAERIAAPLRLASYEELRFSARVADLTGMPRRARSSFDEHTRILWIEGQNIRTGNSAWLPFDLLNLDTTPTPRPGNGAFISSSNGLASGNNWSEAVVHGVCEVIERDAQAAFDAAEPEGQDARRLRLATVDDPDCVDLLERYARAGVNVAAWDTTDRTGVASFLCAIEGLDHGGLGVRYGMGCHPAREIALSRALTEAAQSRLTLISGARDDIWRINYARIADPETAVRERLRFARAPEHRAFADVPTWESDDLDADVRWLLDRLAIAGFDNVLAVDHTVPAFGLSVVHVVVPGAVGPGFLERPSSGQGR